MNSEVCMSTPICDLLSVVVCRIFYSINFCSTSLSHIISLHVLRSLPFSFRNREDAENCSDKANPTEQKVETRGLHCGILETDHILADKKREQPVRERGHWRHGGLSFSAGTNSILVNGSEVQYFECCTWERVRHSLPKPMVQNRAKRLQWKPWGKPAGAILNWQ